MEKILSIIPEENKTEAYDFILSNIFQSGFGVLGKAEIDLILFAALMRFKDREYSDLELSKYLGITQKRIRNYKEKISLRYDQKTTKDAIDYFIEKLPSAKIDGQYIDVPIVDVAVKNELEGILDEHDLLLHSQLNQKIFRIRIDDLFELLLIFQVYANNGDYEHLANATITTLRESQEILDKLNITIAGNEVEVPTLKKKLLTAGAEIGIEVLKDIIPGGGIACTAIKVLYNTFKSQQTD